MPVAHHLAFSPDGKHLLDLKLPKLRIIEPAADWKLKQEIDVEAPAGTSALIAVSRDSKRAAVILATDDRSRVRIFDIGSGDRVSDFQIERRITFGTFGVSNDDFFFGGYTNPKHLIGRIDLRTGKINAEKEIYNPQGVALSPDGKQLLFGQWGNATALSPNDLAQIWSKSTKFGETMAVAYSGDGERVAIADSTGCLELHDAKTGALIGKPPPHHLGYSQFFVIPDGRVFLSGINIDSRLFDFATGRDIYVPKIEGMESTIPTSDFRHLVVALPNEKRVAIVDWQTGKPVRDLKVGLQVLAAVPIGDGRKLLLRTRDTLAIADFQSGVVEKEFPTRGGTVRGLAVDAAGRRAALLHSTNGHLDVYELQAAKLERTIELTGTVWWDRARLIFSRDGQWLACGHSVASYANGPDQGKVRLWAAATGEERLLVVPKGAQPGYALDISPDGEELANGGLDGCVHFWDIMTGKHRRSIRVGPANGVIFNVAYAPDGRHLLVNTPSGMVLLLRLAFANAPFPPLDPAWLDMVAKLPAKDQVEAVKAELIKRNPGFDGNVTPIFGKDSVIGVEFLADNVTDLSPVRAFPGLQKLFCGGSHNAGAQGRIADLSPLRGMQLTEMRVTNNLRISDLTPLKDMKLKSLMCYHTQVSDLSPLKGMPLVALDCSYTQVSDLAPLRDMKLVTLSVGVTNVVDLAPLKGMPLTTLDCYKTKVSDLKPLKGMPLRSVICYHTQVSDLAPLKDAPITRLECSYTLVADLAPLKDMRLTSLSCRYSKVSDLSPLRGMPLETLGCDFNKDRDAEILRSIKSLEKINEKPAADVLAEGSPK